jgi:FtsP/CotA-like multicopper oxidase with cupredoxin domain
VLDDWIDGVDGHTPDTALTTRRNGMAGMSSMGSSDPSPRTTPSTGMPMPGMHMGAGATGPLLGGDAGDVDYPYYLINGRLPADPVTFTAALGRRARIRIINAWRRHRLPLLDLRHQ